MYKSKMAGFSFLVEPLAELAGDCVLVRDEEFWKRQDEFVFNMSFSVYIWLYYLLQNVFRILNIQQTCWKGYMRLPTYGKSSIITSCLCDVDFMIS